MTVEATTIAGRGAIRDRDFTKIARQFDWYYCKGQHPCPTGQKHYYNWLNSLGLDETKPYGKSAEAFRWARDMISLAKEDTENKYYRVLVGFPLESMNGNVYTEAELQATASSLKGVTPNLNHKEYWTLEDKATGLKAEFVDSRFEDNAVEALLKIPKTLKCPDCGKNKTICDLIDDRQIVNVSLEASCEPGNTAYCRGMRLTGCALLTVETLPGIPLARIFPVEQLVDGALKGMDKMVVKVTLKKNKEAEEPQGAPSGQPDQACPEGQVWDAETKTCIPINEVNPVAPKPPEKPSESVEASLRISELELKHFKAEQKAKTLEEQVLNAETMYKGELVKTIEQAAKIKNLGEQVTKLEASILDKDKAITSAKQEALVAQKATQDAVAEARLKVIDAQAETQKILTESKIQLGEAQKRIDEAAISRDAYKTQMEAQKTRGDELDKKYQDANAANLELSKRITAQNEDLLKAGKEVDAVKESLTKARRLGKVIATV